MSSEREPGRLLVRFTDTEAQLKAQEVVKEELGTQYVVALNLAPATPAWLKGMGIRKGDLLARAQIKVPKEPSDEQRALYERLRELEEG